VIRRFAKNAAPVLAALLLVYMAVLSGGAALRESATIDEIAHIGAGVSYLQKLDLRFNEEHPPLAKVLAALPLVVRGTRADYSSIIWTSSQDFFSDFLGQWVFGDWLLNRWNDRVSTLALARLPMLLLTLLLGCVIYIYARRLGGPWAGLLSLSVYASSPVFITFGPLVHTDIPITLFSILTLWCFAGLWQEPNRTNTALFALCLAGALLSKFTAGLLFFVFPALAWSTRWRAVPGQPRTKPEDRAWRRLRWRATLKGILWAALAVYAVYFVFSWNQSTDALDRVGHGPAWVPLRRLLMPPWLYLRGALMVAVMGSRPTFLLGHAYPHGVWFYFPVLFLLKSSLGFLGLLVLVCVAVFMRKRLHGPKSPALIPEELNIHWRVLWVSLAVLGAACLASRLNISYRHFSVPLVLLILLLAPVPSLLARLPRPRLLMALAAALVIVSLFTTARAFPYYFPYINALGMGRPAYALVNDSNVDWNQSLPEVKRFADRHGLEKINLDFYGISDPAPIVPQAQIWNCQRPAASDAGKWAVVSANMILDEHNCIWLMQYPNEPLAGGSMYAIHLPVSIPPVGSRGGPPPLSAQREFWGAPLGTDPRALSVDLIRHPKGMPQAIAGFRAEMMKAQRH